MKGLKENPDLWANFLRAGAAIALMYAEKLSPSTEEGRHSATRTKK